MYLGKGVIHGRDQLRRGYEVGDQHECQARPECRPRRGARGSGLTQVLILTEYNPLEVGLAFIISFSIEIISK